MKSIFFLSLVGFLAISSVYGSAEDLVNSYEKAGAGPFSTANGEAAWLQENRPADGEKARACTNCHGANLNLPGRHIKTGKAIEPMSLSVNPSRFTEPKKVEKWFRRNCRWTFGRECTSQEKGDFIQFIISQ